MGKVANIDTNLQGQKLGKKGKITRERILSVARELIEDRESEFSLSAVARKADLRMSSLYNYFSDVTDLFLAVLQPVADEAEEAYNSLLREPWPEDEIEARAEQLVNAFHAYWQRNSRMLHLRNRMADLHEKRVLLQRIAMARRIVRLLGRQMGGEPGEVTGPAYDMASVLYTGLERVVTIATDEDLKELYPANIKPRFEGKTLKQEARLMALVIAAERRRKQTRDAA